MDNSVSESVKIEPTEGTKKENDVKVTTVSHRDRKHLKEEKTRKKDDKGLEQILKSLSSFDNVEEKLTAICKKYSEAADENRKYQLALKQMEKKIAMIQREKEQFQTERSKAVLTRSRLESLCRELQRQNKVVKEESLLKIREEEEKRKEVSVKFQNTLAEITALMSQNNEENAKLQEDKLELTKKFNIMHKQMEHFEKLHKEIKMEMTEEKEALLKEKQQLICKLTEYHIRVRDLQATEVNLRSQISMYNDKYDEFQNALTKSNEVFGGFNEEMEKMSKKILKLEKETSIWKQRWENTHAALLEMAAEKRMRDSEIAALNRKCSLLQELCRVFQQERATLLAQLREKNKDSENDQTTDKDGKVLAQSDELSSNCQKLQANLAQVENSLSKITKCEDNSPGKKSSKTQEVDKKTQEVEKKSLEVEKKTLEVEKKMQDVDKKPQDVQKKTQDVEGETQDVEKETLDVEKETLDVEKETQDVEKEMQEIEKSMQHSEQVVDKKVTDTDDVQSAEKPSIETDKESEETTSENAESSNHSTEEKEEDECSRRRNEST